MIEAIVSDFGGVLTSPLDLAFTRMQADTGVSAAELGEANRRETEATGHNPLFDLETGRITEARFLAKLEAHLVDILGREIVLHGFGERYMAALDVNERLLARYRELRADGLRFAMLTNNVREWRPHWEPKLPVDELFETIVDSGYEGIRKPDPRIYAIVLERLALPAEACVFIDDLAVNIETARDLGFATVHFIDTDQALADLDAALQLSQPRRSQQ